MQQETCKVKVLQKYAMAEKRIELNKKGGGWFLRVRKFSSTVVNIKHCLSFKAVKTVKS